MTDRMYGTGIAGLSFLAGCIVGGAAGLLYAPQSGMRTRRQLVNFVDDGKDKVGEITDDASAVIHEAIERGRKFMTT
ncbi:MAG: YtxH domain-containing protein [Nitrospira sp.]|nr:YtxH domain-containing protein [Nitrospira sp.]